MVADGGLHVWVRSSGNKPAVSLTGGPGGRGMLTFDRAQAQFLDGGARTFNIQSNGFTVVAVVMFTGTAVDGNYESVFDFTSGANNNNICLIRDAVSNGIMFSLVNQGGGNQCNAIIANAIVVNTWLTIVATYEGSTRISKLTVGSVGSVTTTSQSSQCNQDYVNRDVSFTYMGKSSFGNPFFQGNIAGLYAVDALLSTAQISALNASMFAGLDPQHDVCRACPAGEVPGSGGACGPPAVPAGCPAGSAPDSAQACVACPTGQYKSAADFSACALCPAGTASNSPAAAACAACPAGKIQTQEGQSACVDCPADHFRETESSASLETDCTPCPDFSSSDPGTALETDCL